MDVKTVLRWPLERRWAGMSIYMSIYICSQSSWTRLGRERKDEGRPNSKNGNKVRKQGSDSR